MKLLLYAHDWVPTIGGVQTITLELARGLSAWAGAHGSPVVDVTVATPTPANGMNDAEMPFKVVRQPSLRKLLHLIRGADLIHLAGPSLVPMFAGWLLRKPVVVEHHGFHAVCPNGLLFYEPTRAPCPGHFMAGHHGECLRCNSKEGSLRSFRMWLLTFFRRWLSQRSAANITPTDWLATVLQLPRTTTIHHGLSLPPAGTVERRLESPPAFGFQGRLVSTKGAGLLLQAAHSLKKMGFAFRLNIIGEGPERSALETVTQELGLSDMVTFAGYVPDEDTEDLLAGTSAVVMPSLGGEVFGLVAAENMMRGRPAIVPEGEALAEVVGETGLTFPPGDVAGLAGCMQKILENPSLARELGEKACRRSRHAFDRNRMVQQHLVVYGALLPCKE